MRHIPFVFLAVAMGSIAWAETPATQPALMETDPVRVNGMDFQLVAPALWLTPTDEKGTAIPLALRATNRSDTDQLFDVDGAWTIVLKDETGKQLPVAEGVDGLNKRHPPASIAKGQSAALDRTAQLRRANDKDGTFWLAGQVGLSFWRFDGLKLGRYTLALTYENTDAGPKDAPHWVGKVSTKELAIDITDKPAVSSKPVVKDGLQVTVTLPKATFGSAEPLKFTVDFENVSNNAFMLDDANMFWKWAIRFEDIQTKGPWQLHETFVAERTPAPTNSPLKPGEALTVPIVVDPAKKLFEFVWKGEQLVPVVRQLKPDKYRLTMDIVLEENPLDLQLKWPCWKGKIATEPVEFEITDKPATQPSTQAGPITEVQAKELAAKFAEKAGENWGQPNGVSKHGNEYEVGFETPQHEIQLLGPRTVMVNAVTGKCRFQMRE